MRRRGKDAGGGESDVDGKGRAEAAARPAEAQNRCDLALLIVGSQIRGKIQRAAAGVDGRRGEIPRSG